MSVAAAGTDRAATLLTDGAGLFFSAAASPSRRAATWLDATTAYSYNDYRFRSTIRGHVAMAPTDLPLAVAAGSLPLPGPLRLPARSGGVCASQGGYGQPA
jgi:hypothetical protein